MKISHYAAGLLLASAAFEVTSCGAQPTEVSPLATQLALNAHGGTLSSFDFDTGALWPKMAVYANSSKTRVKVTNDAVGTVNVAGSTQASRGLLFSINPAAGAKTWLAGFSSGPLAVRNSETNLGKLTLSFMLSSSVARPITVRLSSLDKAGKRGGTLEALIYPAAPGFYQRYALDLSTMHAVGKDKFNPIAPFVRLGFEVGSATGGQGWPALTAQVRIDDVNYASPAYYVSPKGSDTNDGRSETTAFATPQKAIDTAGPGDIVLVMDGTYLPIGVQTGIAGFHHGGAPAAWLTLKNYPGQKPLFFVKNTWCGVRIGRSKADAPEGVTLPALSYIEVRGLHVRGEADVTKEKYAELINKADPNTNGNGISVDGGNETFVPHHIRFADNLVEYCNGGGIGAGSADWITTENNVIRNNCWYTIYATSGISYLSVKNFDEQENVYKDLIRNNVVSGNQCFVPWRQVGHMSDGNGIIVDSNYVPAKNQSHRGRTLIQNNLVFGNGGSGIHSFKSHRIDIINNTAYFNGATPELRWGQIFVQITDDVRIMNNIMVSRDDQPVNTVGKNGNDQNSNNVVRANNLYFGGFGTPLMGEGDIVADPQFVNPSLDEKVANFHVATSSPALKTGAWQEFSPLLDLDGKLRPLGAKPDKGSFQQ